MTDRFEKFSSAIFDISHHWHKIAADEMAKYELKGTYAIYLANIARFPDGTTAARLAELCARDKADVSRALTTMEKKGLIAKACANGNSYRAIITLTEKGVMAADHVRERAALAVELAGKDISEKNREIFYSSLDSIAANLRSISETGLPDTDTKIKMVLFDLDGTLAPMDQDEFMNLYFGGLCEKLAPQGYDPNILVKAIWSGVKGIVKNTGSQTNEIVFWNEFKKVYPNVTEQDLAVFEKYYEEDFDKVSTVCTPDQWAKKAVKLIKAKGIRVALATNPLFPRIATEKRIRWTGMEPCEFEMFTTYENSHYAKPNLEYFKELIATLGVKPEQCLMVGNDVSEDMIARELGMKVFLVTDFMINKENKDISQYPNGGFKDLIEYIKKITAHRGDKSI